MGQGVAFERVEWDVHWSEALFCDAARALPGRNAALGSPVHIFYLTLTRTGAKLRGVINETKLLI